MFRPCRWSANLEQNQCDQHGSPAAGAEGSMTRPVNAKKQIRPLAEVRSDLRSLARFLAQQAELDRGPSQRRLSWAAGCLIEYLENRAPSLEHAFGLVRSPGNQGDLKIWADRAAEADREGLSVAKVAERYHLADLKSVRQGLKRGRKVNERAWIESESKRLGDELAAERHALEKTKGVQIS
jgi:hypothetical protein